MGLGTSSQYLVGLCPSPRYAVPKAVLKLVALAEANPQPASKIHKAVLADIRPALNGVGVIHDSGVIIVTELARA
jgi:hypothetical protein